MTRTELIKEIYDISKLSFNLHMDWLDYDLDKFDDRRKVYEKIREIDSRLDDLYFKATQTEIE